MTSVQGLLDQLAAGTVAVDEVARDFAQRKWSPRSALSDAQAWGVEDTDSPGDDTWGQVEADSRLTPDQYAVLAQAHDQAVARG